MAADPGAGVGGLGFRAIHEHNCRRPGNAADSQLNLPMTALAQGELLVIALLAVITLVAFLCRRLRIPYTVALVLAGLVLTTLHVGLSYTITPDVILFIFVPPLAFEAAFHLDWDQLVALLPQIMALAVPGVILTMAIVGGVVYAGGGLALSGVLVFGALISATDPVAVVALFRTFHVPRRLAVLVEAESLFNDGTAIVVFNLALVVALGSAFDPISVVSDFVRVSAGGVVIGAALGFLAARLIAQIDDYLVE